LDHGGSSLLIPILLVIHVGGAIIGFGPTFAFALLGPMAAKAGPNGGVTLMEAMVAIEKRFVYPAAMVTQPLSGLALIFASGYSTAFFSHTWLWVSLLLYAVGFYSAIMVQTPRIEKMIHLAKAGPPTPEFQTLAKKAARLGPVITIILATIVVLMVAKPGG